MAAWGRVRAEVKVEPQTACAIGCVLTSVRTVNIMELVMRFDWDEQKNTLNLKRHRVRFETASLAFEDPGGHHFA